MTETPGRYDIGDTPEPSIQGLGNKLDILSDQIGRLTEGLTALRLISKKQQLEVALKNENVFVLRKTFGSLQGDRLNLIDGRLDRIEERLDLLVGTAEAQSQTAQAQQQSIQQMAQMMQLVLSREEG